MFCLPVSKRPGFCVGWQKCGGGATIGTSPTSALVCLVIHHHHQYLHIAAQHLLISLVQAVSPQTDHAMKLSLVSVVSFLACGAIAHTPTYQRLPPLRDQAELQNKWVAERKAAIPALLEKHHMDAWLVRSLFSLTYTQANHFPIDQPARVRRRNRLLVAQVRRAIFRPPPHYLSLPCSQTRRQQAHSILMDRQHPAGLGRARRAPRRSQPQDHCRQRTP